MVRTVWTAAKIGVCLCSELRTQFRRRKKGGFVCSVVEEGRKKRSGCHNEVNLCKSIVTLLPCIADKEESTGKPAKRKTRIQ